MESKIKPKMLKIGDKVAIVSLSSGILGEDELKLQLELGKRRLTFMGLFPTFMPNALKGIEFIKNNPKARALDLKEAFLDKDIKAIICAIGGDDTYKTIPYLMNDDSFKTIVRENPKIFIGFSDSTNNHLMLNKLGLVTYYGLNFLSDLAELETQMLPYTKDSYELFLQNEDNLEIKSSDTWYENRETYGDEQLGVPLISHKEEKGYEVLFGSGIVDGEFWGGCLESLYDIFTSNRYHDQREVFEKYNLLEDATFYKDKIVFLETSEEKCEPKLFEKMLEVLIKEGVLTNARALIVGKPDDEVYYDKYKEILTTLVKKHKLPTLYNVNVGHALPRTIIPMGLKGQIDFDNSKLFIKEALFSE